MARTPRSAHPVGTGRFTDPPAHTNTIALRGHWRSTRLRHWKRRAGVSFRSSAAITRYAALRRCRITSRRCAAPRPITLPPLVNSAAAAVSTAICVPATGRAFALAYNGPAEADNDYDAKLAAAYAARSER